MTVNADTFVDALLSDAGGRNAFAGQPDRYPTITPEQLGAAKPDVVLLSTEPFPFKPSHADELAERSGLPRDHFQIVDGEMLSWHGSRTPAGIDYAEQVISQCR
jgi:ABC-type Fe3+-hydroxamate transport system substrate-binding protein